MITSYTVFNCIQLYFHHSYSIYKLYTQICN